jgi:hypothetical protein
MSKIMMPIKILPDTPKICGVTPSLSTKHVVCCLRTRLPHINSTFVEHADENSGSGRSPGLRHFLF